jgi:N-acetyl-anhydromuramyl-L-alanine amidase AmpD
MLTQNRSYGSKRESITPIGIVIHSTGANNPSIKRYCQPSDKDTNRSELLSLLGTNTYGNHWNTASASKSAHYIIGKLADGSVATAQMLPENIAAWTCGEGSKGSYNYAPVGHIQFEVCEDSTTNADYFRAAVLKEAVELCADICHRYGWDSSVIVSHKEAHKKGYASNHSDINHWLAYFQRKMSDFRAEVQKLLDEMNKPTEPENVAFEPYSVRMGDNPFNLYNGNGEKIGRVSEGVDLAVLEERGGAVRIEAWLKIDNEG